jgi:pilus assembly protein FimV
MTNSRLHKCILSVVVASTLNLGAFASAHALGLGELKVQSALGQPFSANIAVLANDVSELVASCFKAKMETPDGQFLAFLRVSTAHAQDTGRIAISSSLAIGEPAVKIVVSATCPSHMQREYFALLDLPTVPSVQANASNIDVSPSQQLGVQLSPVVIEVTSSPTDSLRQRQQARKLPKRVEPPLSMQMGLNFPKPASEAVSSRARNVLRLSGADEVTTHELRLSYALSVGWGAETSPMSAAELKKEHARLMQLLGNEPPESSQPVLAPTPSTDEKPISQVNSPHEVSDVGMSRIATWGLVLVCLGSLLWGWSLLQRLRRAEHAQSSAWWNTEEMVALDKDVPDVAHQSASIGQSALDQKIYKPRPETDLYIPECAELRAELGAEEKIHQMHAAYVDKSDSGHLEFVSMSKLASVNVEEISDVTQEAEFWVSVNDLPRAIEILEPQVELEDPESPLPWLYLLDLYRATKNRNKYDALKLRFVKSFNAKVTAYDDDPSPHDERHIEDFAHLMSRICDLWHTDEIVPFLQTLLVDDRGGQREGFELSVYREILFLIGLANELNRTKTDKSDFDAKLAGRDLPELNVEYLLTTNAGAKSAENSKTEFEHQIKLPDKFEIAFEDIDLNKK